VYVNKLNYTEQLIRKTGVFNVSVLTESAPFDLFKQFGFSSGKDTDKFAGKTYKRSGNGLYYITEHANAVISAKVVDALDYGTHTLFVAEVTEAKVLSNEPSVTYDYYFAHIKPKPVAANEAPTEKSTEKKIKRWICKICGYVYEGESLPDDYICPLCKHGVEDFEPID
jgi:flavin reductase (DIM6/NTAB) family NADH-FMN oxidoreductase RutF/rubredoxin